MVVLLVFFFFLEKGKHICIEKNHSSNSNLDNLTSIMYSAGKKKKPNPNNNKKSRSVNGKWDEMQNISVKGRSRQINPAILGFKWHLTEEMCPV